MVKDFEWYPAEDKKRAVRQKQAKKPKLRKSLEPGKVVILLSGRFRGKRVVFLKQLKSGLLLVTGPYKINGVPLRRVNASYVIATSYKVNVGGVNVGSIDDGYFARVVTEKGGDEDAFFASEKVRSIRKIQAKLRTLLTSRLLRIAEGCGVRPAQV